LRYATCDVIRRVGRCHSALACGSRGAHRASISPCCVAGMGPRISRTVPRVLRGRRARGDSLRCSRNPGPNFFAGLIAANEHRPRYRRHKNEGRQSFMRCRPGLGSVENFFEKRHAHSRAVYRRPFVFAGREMAHQLTPARGRPPKDRPRAANLSSFSWLQIGPPGRSQVIAARGRSRGRRMNRNVTLR
jgi:hypothetical protein